MIRPWPSRRGRPTSWLSSPDRPIVDRRPDGNDCGPDCPHYRTGGHRLGGMRLSRHEAQMKEKQIKALRRKARQLGLEIIEKTSGSVATVAAASAQG